MTHPLRPAAPPRPSSAAGAAVPVGARAQSAVTIDLDEVARRVYQLMLDDLRLDLTRRTGRG
ncbi:hypothetical protein [Deinococcus sp.]|uniref:hypothetical protein n=1 Tax=Deinococcus sp. TaxID=47478 RepID=UPI0025BAF105|nr:hypothetical protein [Deinococcus sp.]